MPRPKDKLILDEEIAKRYYTAKQAQQILGMDRDRFNYIMKSREIHRVPFLGGQGYYRKDEIDMLASEIDAFLLAGESSDFDFRPATMDDLEAEDQMAYFNFGEGSRSPERNASRRRYLEVNPYTSFHLYNGDTLVALINLVPLKHEAILEFRQGKRGWTFPSEMIEQYEAGKRLECIIIDLATLTNTTLTNRTIYAGTLLHNLAIQFEKWGAQGIDIKTIDACGGTKEGKNILTRAGFEHTGTYYIPSITDPHIQSSRPMYHLNLDTSDRVLLRRYKQALSSWKEQR
jgi:hypothetical protein